MIKGGPWPCHGHTLPRPWGMVGHMNDNGKVMHGLHDMHAAFSYVGTGECQKHVHMDVRPWAQFHGSVALENRVTKHYQEQNKSQRLQ